MKKKILVLLIITVFLTISCINKKPIKVGFAGGLTGKLSDLGVSGRNGAILAVEEINHENGIHGRKIELIITDDQNDPEIAKKNCKDLISQNVSCIIGNMTSSMTQAVLPICNENKMLLISPSSSSNTFTGIDDYLLRAVDPNVRQTRIYAEYIFSTLHKKRASIILDLSNAAFSTSVKDIFSESFLSAGGDIVTITSFQSDMRFTYQEITKKALSNNPDCVFLITSSIDTALFCQHLKMQTPDICITSSGWAVTHDFLSNSGKFGEGTYFVSSIMVDKNFLSKNNLDFNKRYIARFNSEPDFGAIYSYDSVIMLQAALLEIKKYTPDTIKQAILEIRNFEGVQHTFQIDEYGDPIRPAYIYIVKNDNFTLLEQK